jgi:hypothetical protein
LVYLKIGVTTVGLDDSDWSESEGMALHYGYPCPFWRECAAGHCDLTNGTRSHGSHCSTPEVTRSQKEWEDRMTEKEFNAKKEASTK